MSKPMTKKDYEKMWLKVEKMKYKLSEYKKKNKIPPKQINNNVTEKIDSRAKLDLMNSMIGNLVRKGKSSSLQMEILIEIANDYEKRLEEE